MKDLRAFRLQIVEPALDYLHRLGGPEPTRSAIRLLLAIARQEGGPNLARHQVGGPAHGAWQFEMGGGVKGVMRHPRTADLASALVRSFGIVPTVADVYDALPTNDVLACGFARLLLWTNPAPLPHAEHEAWAEYLMLWRPGKPHPEKWPENWRLAGESMDDTQ